MDWSQPVRDFLRYLSPIFLFARARDLLRHCCDLGYVFLRFFAAEHLCRSLLHAGFAIAQLGNRRIVFFSALGLRSTIVDLVYSRVERFRSMTIDSYVVE